MSDAGHPFALGALSGRVWGANRPPLLLLHGLASTRHIWDLVVPRLANAFTVVAVDLPGHGESHAAGGTLDFPRITAELIALLAHLGLERPIVAGHSWGAAVALELAAHTEISHLVLVDGGYGDFRSMPGMTWEELSAHLAPPRIDMPRAAFLATLPEMFGPAWRPEFADVFLAGMHEDGDRITPRLAWEDHMRILHAMWEQDLPDLYRRIAAPTLLLVADRHGPGTLDWSRLKADAIPAMRALMAAPLRVVHLPDTVHDIPLQRPDDLAALIPDFAASR